jgi:hypothetical protein
VYTIETFKTQLATKLNLITGLTFVVSSNVIANITKINIYSENNLFKIILGTSVIADYLGYDAITPVNFTKMISSTKNPIFTTALIDTNNTIVIQIIRDFSYILPIQIYSNIDQLMEIIKTGMNLAITSQNYSYSISNNIITFTSPNNPIIISFGEPDVYKLAKLIGFYPTNTTDYSSTIIGNNAYYLGYQLSDISIDLITIYKFTQVELKYISIDNNIYNIDSRNNTFKFIIKNTSTNVETSYSLTIIDGTYSPQDYIEKINAQFISNSLSITSSFNTLNQKISFTCSGNFTMKYIDSIYTNKLLGFNNNVTRSFTNVLSSDYVVNFSKKKLIFIDCNNNKFLVEIGQPSKLPISLNWTDTISKLDIILKDEYDEPINIVSNWIAIFNFI